MYASSAKIYDSDVGYTLALMCTCETNWQKICKKISNLSASATYTKVALRYTIQMWGKP